MAVSALQNENVSISPVSDQAQVSAIVKAVVRSVDKWNLNNAEAAALFDVSPTTWNRMKADKYKGSLDQDKVTRASLLIGLFKGLRLLFNGPLTYGWVKCKNKGTLFKGEAPVDYMKHGGIPAMVAVRQHIDALRGGL